MLSFGVVVPSLRLGYSFGEYVRFEADARERHEYVRGLILAMAGGTLEHARRTAKVIELLGEQLRGKRCSVFDSNARIRAPSGNAYYPDASAVCGAVTTDAEDALSATNPTVLVEVSSPSTAEYDRTDKLDDYRRLASLRHAVLIADDAERMDVWTRSGDDWSMRSFGPGERAALDAIGCTLDVGEIYGDPLAP